MQASGGKVGCQWVRLPSPPAIVTSRGDAVLSDVHGGKRWNAELCHQQQARFAMPCWRAASSVRSHSRRSWRSVARRNSSSGFSLSRCPCRADGRPGEPAVCRLDGRTVPASDCPAAWQRFMVRHKTLQRRSRRVDDCAARPSLVRVDAGRSLFRLLCVVFGSARGHVTRGWTGVP